MLTSQRYTSSLETSSLGHAMYIIDLRSAHRRKPGCSQGARGVDIREMREGGGAHMLLDKPKLHPQAAS